ncbi:MAG TPA: alpha/beta hydrolase family protein [Armatimonadota bacterium]|jgi:S-formylglutathione hydrolase FrmB
MSLLHINYFSAALEKQSAMYAILPTGDGPFRTMYMLHGLSDDYTIWLRRTSIERYADELGICVVLLDGARSFYTDAENGGAKYEQHILESVAFIDRTLHTVNAPEARGIGGLSMGGYGAMKLGLKHPEIFGSVASHSGVLDLATFVDLGNNPEFTAIFGAHVAPTEDCFALAETPGAKPALYIDCGEDDFLIEHNRRFHAHLTQLGIAHEYAEYPGAHSWEYWDQHVPAALRFHLAHSAAHA